MQRAVKRPGSPLSLFPSVFSRSSVMTVALVAGLARCSLPVPVPVPAGTGVRASAGRAHAAGPCCAACRVAGAPRAA